MIPFSIVIPYYNSSNSLDRLFITLNDYLNKNCEIIIVDDCSQKNELDLLKEKIDVSGAKNIILKECKINNGAAFARQLGVDYATGEYVAFLDSDDGWVLNRIYFLVDFMKDNKVDIIGGETNVINDLDFFESRNSDIYTNGKEVVFKNFLFKNYFSTPSVIVRKDIFQKNKFNITMRYSEDFECWRRIVYSSKSFLMYDSGCYSFKHSYISNNKNSLSAATRKMSIGEIKGLMYLFKNNNINLGYKILLPFAILYSFIKAFYREIRVLKVSK